MADRHHINRLTFGGVLLALGIVYGDIGTSPLYVMKAIIGTAPVSPALVLGGISCVFWTLTIITSFKYVGLTLKADNHGEGGIFSLFALSRRINKHLIAVTMIGGAALLSESVLTPPITVSAAVEGLHAYSPNVPVVPIVLVIITLLFLFQRKGTAAVGRAFGPIMASWFTMLAVLGLMQIFFNPEVLNAVNPLYAWRLLTEYPDGFWLLGSVFLAATGAEALYSDLGHCGRENIRVSWGFVKVSLLLNYFGQGAWLLNHKGVHLADAQVSLMGATLDGRNPFFAIMPTWFVPIGIVLSSAAAIIASQALISGAFTLVGEAIRQNLLPKIKVVFPSEYKAQIFVPAVNLIMWLGCVGIVLFFRESSAMEAAYGLSVTITMIMTTILLTVFLRLKRYAVWKISLISTGLLIVESAFLVANLAKFEKGGYITLSFSLVLIFLMWVTSRSTFLKKKLSKYVEIKRFIPQLDKLKQDKRIPKYATNLVYLSKAKHKTDVEYLILHSILQRQIKRADRYWFVHVKVLDEPYGEYYDLHEFEHDLAYKVTFYLGFKEQPRLSAFMKALVEKLIEEGNLTEIKMPFHLDQEQCVTGDFRYMLVENIVTQETGLPFWQQLVLSVHMFIRRFTATPAKWFGLDDTLISYEQVPLIYKIPKQLEFKRL